VLGPALIDKNTVIGNSACTAKDNASVIKAKPHPLVQTADLFQVKLAQRAELITAISSSA
jgi:hypothetical protein